MHEDMGSNEGSIPSGAERLLRRIDEVTRDIARMREERAADPVRAARVHLAAVHGAKRLKQHLKQDPGAERRRA